MSYIQKVLRESIKKYPQMEVQDALKLIYQSEFGCGHLIKNKEASYAMFMEEWRNIQESSDELFEIIGDGYARFNISAAKKYGVSPKVFQQIFLKSAEVESGTMEKFYEKVRELKKLCIEEQLPFSIGDIDSFLSQWEKSERPLFRHSKKYRELYKPTYRVITEEYISILPALMKIDSELNKKEKVIIGIDGPCGSGKTTLSKLLAEFYNSPTIHMDDFFLPPTLRTEKRLAEPGGNIHYERFLDEVVTKIKIFDTFRYRIFSCRRMDYHGEATIRPCNVLIVEGSYSMHPLFNSIYDVKLFCDIDIEEQKERIIKRNGLDIYKTFKAKWIPMENRYFEEFSIMEKCDVLIHS